MKSNSEFMKSNSEFMKTHIELMKSYIEIMKSYIEIMKNSGNRRFCSINSWLNRTQPDGVGWMY